VLDGNRGLSYPVEKTCEETEMEPGPAGLAGLVSVALSAFAMFLIVAAFALPHLQLGFQSEARILVKNLAGYSDGKISRSAFSPRADRERQLRLHAEIAASDAFALELIERLDLRRHREFSGASRSSPIRGILSAAGLASAETVIVRDELLLAALKRKMRVAYMTNLPVLSIRFRVSDGELAAALAAEAANAYAELLQNSGFPPSSARPISHASAPAKLPFGYSVVLLIAAAGAGAARTRLLRRVRNQRGGPGNTRTRVSRTLLPERIGEPSLVRLRKGPDPADIFSALLQNQW
jgi:hypothetical protein